MTAPDRKLTEEEAARFKAIKARNKAIRQAFDDLLSERSALNSVGSDLWDKISYRLCLRKDLGWMIQDRHDGLFVVQESEMTTGATK